MTPAHEFIEGWCKWCGLKENPNAHQYGCLQRSIPSSELAPEPRRRQFALEDYDTIGARLAELAKERLPGVPEPQMDLGDCCG